MPGFVNVQLRDGSSDGGRDIEAEYVSKMPDGMTERRENWWFESKKYSNGIPFDVIAGKIHRANGQRINRFVIMSNMHLTPQCQDEIKAIKDTLFCDIIDWTGLKFQDLLFKYPHICDEFFPDEKIPQQLDTEKPQELIQKTQKSGLNFGIEIKLKEGQKVPKDIYEAAKILKESVLELKEIDLNFKALIYSHISGLFLSISWYRDALFFIDESLHITPNNIAALLNKALIFENLGRLEDAIECYDHILGLEDKNKFALNNKANVLRKKGKLEDALDLVEESLDIDAEFIMAINTKVSILRYLGNIEEALDFIESKLSIQQDSKVLLDAKVSILIDLMDFKEAMRLNDQIIEMYPNDMEAINSKGVIYEHNSKYQNKEKYINLAMECFEEAIAGKEGEFPLGWANKVVCMTNNGELDDADVLIENILKRYPTNPQILNEKGMTFLRKGKPKNLRKALRFFNRSIRYEPSVLVFINKAHALYGLHQYEKVVKTINLIHNNQNPDAWNIKGHALERLHQIKKSKDCFEKANEYTQEPRSLLE